MKICLIVLFLASALFCQAQEKTELDSLKQLLKSGIHDTTAIDVLHNISKKYAPYNFDSSNSYTQISINLSQRIGDKNREAVSFKRLGIAYDYKGELDTALLWYDKSLKLYQELKDTSGVATIYLNIGVCYHYGTMYDSALMYYKRAAELHEKLGVDDKLSYDFNNIGLIFRLQGDYKRALEYYQKSLSLKRKMNDKPGIITTLGNVATCYRYMEKLDSAGIHLLEGLKIAEDIGDSALIGYTYLNLGNNLHFQGKYNEALIYQLKAQETLKKVGEQRDIQQNMLNMGLTYLRLKSYSDAEHFFIEANKIAEKFDMIEAQSNIALGLSELYEETGRLSESLVFYKKHFELSASMLNEKKTSIVEELEQKYQSELKQKEIAKLEVEQQTSENERNLFLMIASGVVLLAIFLFVLLRQKSKSNATITQSLAEKETLLGEIHHRVKNNLQVISSLLSLQSRFIEDKGAVDAINEGQTRVESMGLIHQKLYQDNNFSGVNALDYIQDLAHVLNTSYGAEERVKVHYSIDDLNIDVDTIIPIGLILNELISNSFKHAFPAGREGNLYISLHESNQKLSLDVSDDGAGINNKRTDNNSFGLILIESLAQKLKATVETTFENGAKTSLQITNYKLV